MIIVETIVKESFDDGSFITWQHRKEERVTFFHNSNHRRVLSLELGSEVMFALHDENEPFRPVYVHDSPYDWLYKRMRY